MGYMMQQLQNEHSFSHWFMNVVVAILFKLSMLFSVKVFFNITQFKNNHLWPRMHDFHYAICHTFNNNWCLKNWPIDPVILNYWLHIYTIWPLILPPSFSPLPPHFSSLLTLPHFSLLTSPSSSLLPTPLNPPPCPSSSLLLTSHSSSLPEGAGVRRNEG